MFCRYMRVYVGVCVCASVGVGWWVGVCVSECRSVAVKVCADLFG